MKRYEATFNASLLATYYFGLRAVMPLVLPQIRNAVNDYDFHSFA